MPAWGGCERLAEIVGRGRALLLVTSGRLLSAPDAFAYGLVDQVVPRADFDATVDATARAIAALAPTASRRIKHAIAAVKPASHRHVEAGAVEAFVALWLGEQHWTLIDALLTDDTRTSDRA